MKRPEASGHGGNIRELARLAGCGIDELLDFSASINPIGPPESLRSVISRHIDMIKHYPDAGCRALREAVAKDTGVPIENIVIGNGSTEILFSIPHILGCRRAVIPAPAYIDYGFAAEKAGLQTEYIVLDESDGFSMDWDRVGSALAGSELVFIGRPSNPIGDMTDKADLYTFADRNPSDYFIVDEAFGDFVEDFDSAASPQRPNIIVLRSMTKFYAIPGLRLGYALAPANLADKLRRSIPPWSVNTLAQAFGCTAIQDKAFKKKTVQAVAKWRRRLVGDINSLDGIRALPSSANYVTVRLDGALNMNAGDLGRELLRHRIAIRACDNYEGLDNRYFRLAVRTEEENNRLITALGEALKGRRVRRRPARKKVPAVMFQGVSSNAGKSVLTAAFCRILFQDGYRVAPFKSQNMSLNSYATADGTEMGRAQVLQAQACRLDPDVRMNPVLLKPNTNTGSQVIVMGKPVANMEAEDYIDYKTEAFDAIKEAYASLSSHADAVVIEGAGSPGEVNLRKHDIANMPIADMAGAPVLIVGDIDRGGVFASFVGTLEVLTEKDRSMVSGFVINRFRGLESLLDDAIDYIGARTGLPTYGVVPFIENLGLPEEDGVTFKEDLRSPRTKKDSQVEVAVIDLPHISNFTDFDPFALENDVCLRVIRDADALGSPDAVIIPGSKNVPCDLLGLRDSGLADRIIGLARRGCVTVGICGGFQMLGRDIFDPHMIEAREIRHPGLSLLSVDTVLEADKTIKSVSALHAESGLKIRGYEIHHGRTFSHGDVPAMSRENGEVIGFSSQDGLIFGTYLHGLFDDDLFRRWFINKLRLRHGLEKTDNITAYDIEPAIDRLAEIVRRSLDIKAIYRTMGL